MAEIDVTISYPQGKMPLRHRLKFDMVGQRAELIDEAIENERPNCPDAPDALFYFRYQNKRPILNVKTDDPATDGRARRMLWRDDLPLDQSIVSQRKDPD